MGDVVELAPARRGGGWMSFAKPLRMIFAECASSTERLSSDAESWIFTGRLTKPKNTHVSC